LRGMLPLRPPDANELTFVGRSHTPDEAPWSVDYWQIVSDGALDALGARIVRGRGIARGDVESAPPVVVINQAFAAWFFAGEDPIGKQLVLNELRDHAPR